MKYWPTSRAVRKVCVGFSAVVFWVGFASAEDLAIDRVACVAPNAFINSGIVTSGIAPIPAALLDRIAPYTKFRSSFLMGWRPSSGGALVKEQPAAGDNIGRLVLLKQPASAATVLPAVDGDVIDARLLAGDDESLVALHRPAGRSQTFLTRISVATGVAQPISARNESVNSIAWSRLGGPITIAFVTDRASGSESDPRSSTSRLYTRELLPSIHGKQIEKRKSVDSPVGSRWRDLAFSVDGRELVYVEQAAEGESIWTRDISTGAAKRVTGDRSLGVNDLTVNYSTPQFSVDGKTVVALSSAKGGRVDLLRIDRESGASINLTQQLKGEVIEFAVSRKNLIALTTLESGSSVLRFFDLLTGKEQLRPALFPGAIKQLRWHESGDALGFSMASARAPMEVYGYDVNTTKLIRWTNGAVAGLSAFNFPEPQRIGWQAGDHNMAGHFWQPDPMVFPGKRPVVISLTAAVTKNAAVGFIDVANYFVVEDGFAIIRPDPSSLPAVVSLVEWIEGQPNLDATRIALVADGDAAGLAGELLRRHGRQLFKAAIVESKEAISLANTNGASLLLVQDGGRKISALPAMPAAMPSCQIADSGVAGADRRSEIVAAVRANFLEAAFRENKKGGH